METAELLSRLKPRSTYDTQAGILREDSDIYTIVDLIRPQEPWEMCLNALANLQKEPQELVKLGQNYVWHGSSLSTPANVSCNRVRKFNAKGEWSKGRPIAIKPKGIWVSLIILHLRISGACIETFTSYDYGYHAKTEYTFNAKAILR